MIARPLPSLCQPIPGAGAERTMLAAGHKRPTSAANGAAGGRPKKTTD